ncbi:N-acetylmuramoyl-L-alanine amidase [Texcoconibacillus texcoconensis]|uniref:N-acetylmuramoyl-L-alanine amidase n=1 Tax=Texcoconibacillus texcoconensis TaxID=1095777 RepID=A0A840QTB6_9BACI|nr:N-acetylmuramoyl-L-alanine amidase [Texcoconibacillus texcoconensis]MBB5174590.1 N-acetylmuramoyl-L-alanine amidase [Texcoconibacillus texcoconensis]
MKKFASVSLSVPLALSLVFNINTETVHADSTFPDIDIDEVDTLVEDEIVSGYPDGYFYPRDEVTRAEAAVMIGRAHDVDGEERDTSFPDVSESHYASGYIASIAEMDIIQGHTNGSFAPNDSLTRGDMAEILNDAFDYEQTQELSFNDVHEDDYFSDAVDVIAGSGITIGYPDGTYRPERSITREEFSLFVARTLYPEYRAEYISDSGSNDDENEEEESKEEEEKNEEVNEDVIAEGTVVRASVLNVRPDPSTNHTPVGQINTHDRVDIHDTEDGWAQIRIDDIEGYISKQYVTVHDPALSGDELDGTSIVVDAGHGGRDPGAIANGLEEKEIALDVSLRLEAQLAYAGADVIMTRTSDTYPSLDDRVELTNHNNADSFVSVHANAAGNPDANGTETYWNATYASSGSKQLATDVQTELLAKLGTNDRGVKEGNFKVIRETTMPSILVELGFMTSPSDAELMKTRDFRENSAQAMLDGFINYHN